MHKSIFTISLDFELHWGGFEKWDLAERRDYFIRTRALIPQLLKAFEISSVHCTWATVGLLMHENINDLIATFPAIKPAYTNQNLSAYEFIDGGHVGATELKDPIHFADSIVKMILASPHQELGSHSYAHYYCNEPGQTPEQFEADGLAWNRAGEKYGVQAESLVFPRNQFNSEYLKKCKEVGLRIVRSNPVDWWWKIDSTEDESKWKRLNRGLDAYINLGGKASYNLDSVKQEEGVWLLPASRLLRPYNPKEFFLNCWKINKIKKEMTFAAENNECYHLWWHPHNFANYSQQNMNGLIQILNHYQYLNKQFGMMSLNMSEISDVLDNA